MTTQLPNLKPMSSAVSPEIRAGFDALRVLFAGLAKEGGLLSALDLVATGLLRRQSNGSLAPNAPYLDATIPPRLAGVQATGAFNSIMLTWDAPRYARLAHVEVYRAEVDNLGQAVRIGTTQSTMYADTPPRSSLSVTYYYWVRIVSQANIAGPFNATAGTPGSTANDPEYLLEVLTGQIKEGQLYADLGGRINLIDAPGSGLLAQVDELSLNQLNSLDEYNTQYLRVLDHENKLNAIVTVDPNTGQIQLLAEANVTTDVEARLTVVETDLDAAEGTIASNVARLDAVDGDITSMNSSITQLSNSVALKAEKAYVDSAVLGIGDSMTPEQRNIMDGLGPEAILRMVLLGDKMNRESLQHKVNIAQAQFDIESNADAISAEAEARLLLVAQVQDAVAAVSVEQTARAEADAAEAEARTQLAAKVDENTAAIQTEQATRADAISALSQSVETVQSTVDGQTATVQEISSSIDGIMAEKILKVDANGVAAAIGLRSEPGGSEVGVYAGRFFIADPAGGANMVLPFIVSGGKVYMDTALIKAATIKAAMIESLSADKLTVPGTGTIWEAIINLGKITSAYIGDFIQSNNYFPGQSGWHINKDGSAEFRNILARGNIEATSLKADAADIVKTLNIQGEAVVVPRAVSAGYQTFSAPAAWGNVLGISLTYTVDAATVHPVTLVASVDSGILGDYRGNTLRFRIARNGNAFSHEVRGGSSVSYGGWFNINKTSSIVWKDEPGAGTHTYTLQCWSSNAGINIAAESMGSGLILQGAKR